jgi:(E)-4-hydroxy-3-methylbut-2-enyl-diphosphate synthase
MRRQTVTVDVGGVPIGSDHPVVVQSMTNTDTADADATAIQVARLAHAGSELVRVTVNTEEAAAAVPEMVRKVRGLGVDAPIIGDFHYNGHKLLVEYPETARVLAKYRINPGNVGAKRHDEHFATIVKVAIDNDRPVRIGVNWGSLDQAILTELMDANARLAAPRDSRDVMIDAMLESALRSAELAETTGPGYDISSSAPRSAACATSSTLSTTGRPLRLPAHLGLTEAGMGDRASSPDRGSRDPLNEGIGDTIRVSSPQPAPARAGGRIAQQVLQSMASARSSPRCRPVRAAPHDFDVLPGDGPAIQSYLGIGCPSGRRRTLVPRTWVAVRLCRERAGSKHADIASACRARSRSPSRQSSSTGDSIARPWRRPRRGVHRILETGARRFPAPAVAMESPDPATGVSSMRPRGQAGAWQCAVGAGRRFEASTHPGVYFSQLNGRSVTWVTPTFFYGPAVAWHMARGGDR